MFLLGSGESHTAYFYSRVPPGLAASARMQTRKQVRLRDELAEVTVVLPLRHHDSGQTEEEVSCDPCFHDSIKIALSRATDLKSHVLQLCLHEPKVITRSIDK